MKKPSFSNAIKIGIDLLFKGRFTLTFDQLDFHVTNLTFRKRFNLIVQGSQLLMRSARRIWFPPILSVEPTNICNLKCLTCATGASMMERQSTTMPFDMFRQIIDQVKDYTNLLVFWSWGEPFINKDAFRMIRYAKDQGLIVHTSTNGHFFKTREVARQVVESGLDSLVVAVDGLDQVSYEQYRKGGTLELVINSIKNLVDVRNDMGVKHPLIIFRFIVMKHNEHQVSQVKAFAADLGVDVLTFRSAVIQRSDISLESDLTPEATKYQQFDYKDMPSEETRLQRRTNYCHRPYANLMVFSNGDVVSCENDFNASKPLGNITDQSLREILTSETSRSFLKEFRKDLDQFHFCQTCELRDIKHKTANVETIILNRNNYEYAKKH